MEPADEYGNSKKKASEHNDAVLASGNVLFKRYSGKKTNQRQIARVRRYHMLRVRRAATRQRCQKDVCHPFRDPT